MARRAARATQRPQPQPQPQGAYEYADDWFTNNLGRWSEYVLPFLRRVARTSARPPAMLEVGAHEGRASLYALHHVPRLRAWLVDDWAAKPGALARLRHNLDVFGGGDARDSSRARATVVVPKKGGVPDALARAPELTRRSGGFDLVYLDWGADSRERLEAAVLAFPLLRPGGMLVFDDYTSNREHDAACPKQGIDAFLDLYAPDLAVLHMSWQVMATKRGTPASPRLPRRACHSEYYPVPRPGKA